MTERRWKPVGYERIDDPANIDRIPAFDARSGDHLWIVTVAYRVDPVTMTSPDPDVTPMLDHENLLAVAGPCCYHCLQAYTAAVSRRRCPGKPPMGAD